MTETAAHPPQAGHEGGGEEKKKDAKPKGGDHPEGKKEKKVGGGEASHDVTPEQKKKIIEEYLKEHEGGHKESGSGEYDLPSIWETSQDYVRGPLQKLFKVGLFVANPIAYAGVWGADKLLTKTPVIKHLYNKPREMIRSTAAHVRDLTTTVLTSPAAIPDIAENVYEGITGNMQKEARGKIGRFFEIAGEKGGEFIRFLWESGGKVLTFGKDFSIGALKMAFEPIKGLGKAVGGVNDALGKIPVVGPFLPAVLTGGLIYGGHLALTGLLTAYAPTAAAGYAGFLELLKQSIGKLFVK